MLPPVLCTPIAVRTKPVTTPTILPPVSYPELPEFPTLWIVFGVAGFAGIVLIIAFIRRWWIRRQNPALFRKYEIKRRGRFFGVVLYIQSNKKSDFNLS